MSPRPSCTSSTTAGWAEGEDAYHPRSRRPHHNPGATPAAVRERVLTLREELLARRLDAGADTLGWHLATEQITCSTVIDATTGEILTEHTLDPAHTYQPKNG